MKCKIRYRKKNRRKMAAKNRQPNQTGSEFVIQIANAKRKSNGQKQKFKNQKFPTLK